jgi:hypothetical protein
VAIAFAPDSRDRELSEVGAAEQRDATRAVPAR